MPRIKFKATRRKHDSGYAVLEKSGDLQFDQDSNARDGIWLYLQDGGRIFIHCHYKTREFEIVFEEKTFKKDNQ